MRQRYFFPALALLAACQAGAPDDAGAPPPAAQRAAALRAPGVPPSLHATARDAFASLLDRAARGEPRLSGVPEKGEAADARLGEPLPVAMVRLDQLKAHRAGEAVDALIQPLELAIYPVQVGAETRAELEMAPVDGVWRAISVGGAGHARVVADLRARPAAGEPAYLLRVPALGVEFLARQARGGLTLTPLFASPAAGLAAGKALPAREAVERLLPLAEAHGGEPT